MSISENTIKIFVPRIVKETKTNRRNLKITICSKKVFKKPQKLVISEFFKNAIVTAFWGSGKERNYLYIVLSSTSKDDVYSSELEAYYTDTDLSNILISMLKKF